MQSRGTTQVDQQLVLFVPTDIGLPANAGIADRTSLQGFGSCGSPDRLARELRWVWVEHCFQPSQRLSGNFHQPTFLVHRR